MDSMLTGLLDVYLGLLVHLRPLHFSFHKLLCCAHVGARELLPLLPPAPIFSLVLMVALWMGMLGGGALSNSVSST